MGFLEAIAVSLGTCSKFEIFDRAIVDLKKYFLGKFKQLQLHWGCQALANSMVVVKEGLALATRL